MIDYRQATSDDVTDLASLLHEIMIHHGVDSPGRQRLEDTAAAAIRSPDHLFLLAEVDGVIAGMCALLFSFSTWSAGPVCELQDVVVGDKWRRRGVGQGLIQMAERVAQERGSARLYLQAETWNLEAHAFYRSLGFAEKTCLYFERDLSRSTTGTSTT